MIDLIYLILKTNKILTFLHIGAYKNEFQEKPTLKSTYRNNKKRLSNKQIDALNFNIFN